MRVLPSLALALAQQAAAVHPLSEDPVLLDLVPELAAAMARNTARSADPKPSPISLFIAVKSAPGNVARRARSHAGRRGNRAPGGLSRHVPAP